MKPDVRTICQSAKCCKNVHNSLVNKKHPQGTHQQVDKEVDGQLAEGHPDPGDPRPVEKEGVDKAAHHGGEDIPGEEGPGGVEEEPDDVRGEPRHQAVDGAIDQGPQGVDITSRALLMSKSGSSG